MSWKTALYNYVHHRNQLDMEYSVESVLPFVSDHNYLNKEADRLRRKCAMDQARGITPTKKETRLSVQRFAEREDQVTADIKLVCSTVGVQAQQELSEQRVEWERITLRPEEDGWDIVRIEPLQTERSLITLPSDGGLLQADEAFHATAPMRLPSSPLLNPQVQPWAPRARYNRAAAVAYADAWWDKGNPDYITFEVDCTNFVSQCLYAGGAAMNYTGRRDSGWWYKGRFGGQEHWSYSWAVANSLLYYLLRSRTGLRAEEVNSPEQLELGDVICYDWNGDGTFQHNTIITAKDANGMPLVNAHTTNSKHRFWSYRDSPSWSERTQYRFLHIVESM
ncbi:amidase domain-containing protein [Paenibacillus silviterrae]|uniref:amidase domain-containing protein n=1 Tax=Paenibacillus silviterrae TaxID=3242194 RepID=UPI002542AE25|nr:amidase domain-containing protein [Paenibacillus chinjuensis]